MIIDKSFIEILAQDVIKMRFYIDKDAHKGLYGRTLVIAGSADIYGACFLCAKAAFRAGAGLVKIVTHENNRQTLQHDLPEAMFSFYKEEFKESLISDLLSFDTIVTGPGLSQTPVAKALVKAVISQADFSKQILVFDADALNILASDKGLFDLLISRLKGVGDPHVVFTPHEGELKRLFNGIGGSKDPDSFAKSLYERFKITLLRKGSYTRVYGKERYINTTGNDGMATAGSGDVLSGILGGCLHRFILGGETNFAKEVTAASFIHGTAGNLAKEKTGSISMMAGDILNEINNVMRTFFEEK